MEDNRNNGMNGMNPNMGGMNPQMGGMNPNMGAPANPGVMNQGMNGMNPNMGGMNPPMNPNMNPNMGGMNPPMNPNMGAANRPPVGKPAAGGNAGSTAIVPLGAKKAEPDKKKKAKKKRPNVAPNVFAVLLFALMAGGLFLGMLQGFWKYFAPSSLYLPDGVENKTLTNSLIGIMIDAVMNIAGYLQFDFSNGITVGLMGALKHLLPAVGLLVLAVALIYGLIAMLIALFSRMNGRRALQVVSSCMLVGYGGCGFFTLLFGNIDFVCLAIAIVGFLVAFITTMIVNKQIGILNSIISLLSIGATALFALPMCGLREYCIESTSPTALIVGFVAIGVLYVNLLVTSARICAKKGKIFDLVFHVLQFAAIATVLVMAFLSKDPTYNLLGMFMPLVCAIGAPALSLIALALSILIIFMPKILKKAEEKKAKKAGKTVIAKEKIKKSKEKTKEIVDEQRPINPMLPYGQPNALPNGTVAPNMQQGKQQPMPPAGPQPQGRQPMPNPQQQPPMRPMPNQQPQRPPMRQNQPRGGADDEFSKSATSFKVPFSTGGGKKDDSATQAALEKLAQEMRAMKDAQSARPSNEITPQEDSETKAAIDNLAEQLRAMKEAQAQPSNQSDPETKSAIEQLTEELRAMKEAQAKAEEERRAAEEARLEAERKAQDDSRIAEAERIAAEARAEAERIAKEAEEKAEQARLEAAKQTEEERKKLEEERRKLEEERKAAEEARLEAERKAQEAREEAERRAEEARLEAERKEAERKAEEERRAQEEARLEAERQAAEAKEEAERLAREAEEAKAEAERQAAEARAEAERQAAEAKAEAERLAEEARQKLEEEKMKLEEERKAMEEARLEEERKRKEEMEQFKKELLEMKNAQAAQPAEPEKTEADSKDENMAKIMEELRALKEAQANAGSTTVNYMSDDSNKQALSEFEKRMEDLIRSQKQEAKPKREPTAFEKRMAQLAAKKAAQQAAAAAMADGAIETSGVAASPAPAPAPAAQAQKPAAQPTAQAAPQQPAAEEAAKYGNQIYDPFITTLTTAEINEFGDIFIADKYGVLAYMPAYVIGGDNKNFFNKIFIYLGKFRSHISQPLLDKLFKYMRSR